MKKVLIKRFLTFIQSIKNSKKIALKNLFYCIKDDCRSVTGSNLANIKALVNKSNIDELVPADCMDIDYNVIPVEEVWRVEVVKELTDVKFGEAELSGFSKDEIQCILEDVCKN